MRPQHVSQWLFLCLRRQPQTGMPRVLSRALHTKQTPVARPKHLPSRAVTRLFSCCRRTGDVITQENSQTVINSPYEDVPHDTKSFGEFMFAFLDEYKNLDLMVGIQTLAEWFIKLCT